MKTSVTLKILVLSKDHRVYMGGFYLANSIQSAGDFLNKKGLHVGDPIGIRPPYFIFLLDNEIPGEELGSHLKNPDWKLISEVINQNKEIESVYVELMLGGFKPPTHFFDVFHFGSGAMMAAKLGHLVVKGKKRGAAGWVRFHEKTNTLIPEVDGISIVTDGFGLPLCVIKTVSVEKVRFRDVTAQMALIEGEGDLTLEGWKRSHLEYWQNYDSQQINEDFSDEEFIYFETFKVIKIIGNQDT